MVGSKRIRWMMAKKRTSDRATPTSRYTLNLTHRGGTHATILELVPEESRVLELGCASGYLGVLLHQRQCKLWGMDSDTSALEQIPQEIYESTTHIDLDHLHIWPLPPYSADVVLAADILEHLVKPEKLLTQMHEILAPGGLLIISLPNVAHISVRLPLLLGRFRYQPSGILDQTHLHLYTFATARELINNAGFTIENVLSGSDWSGWFLNDPRTSRVANVLRGLLATNIIITARSE